MFEMSGEIKVSDGAERSPKHFLLLPYPAFGHITPLLELSRKIVAAGHCASLAVSESLLSDMRTRKMMTPQEEKVIQFVGLKDGVRHVFDEQMSTEVMCGVTDKCSEFLEVFISQLPAVVSEKDENDHDIIMEHVDVILADITFGAVPFEVAVRRGITCFGFSPMAGFIAAQMFRVTEDSPTAEGDYDIIKEADPNVVFAAWKDRLIRGNNALLKTDGILLNSFEALEPTFRETVAQLRPDFKDLKIGFVGPILPTGQDYDATHDTETHQIVKWLDAQPERSVVYFSFGTVAVANVEQIKEITETLIGLNRPFIWSLRPAQQKFLPTEMQEAIKHEFDSTNKPYLIVPWAPQKAILKHKATRVFVAACPRCCVCQPLRMEQYAGRDLQRRSYRRLGKNQTNCTKYTPMLGDQHGNAELVSVIGCGKKLAKVDMMGERVVGREELTDIIGQVAQWNKPLTDNVFFTMAQHLGQAATAAINEGGNCAETFKYLLNTPSKKC